MGSQLKKADGFIRAATNGSAGHAAPVDPGMTATALHCMGHMDTLTTLRNRVVHDIWYPDTAHGHADGLWGDRATPFGDRHIISRRASLDHLAHLFYLATECLTNTALAIHAIREHGREAGEPRVVTPIREAERFQRILAGRMDAMRRGNEPRWVWRVVDH
jgi:hypothetical protein